jgi:hypothetical protein
MGRPLLNALPNWALILLFVGIVVLVALGGLYVVRSRMPSWRAEESSQVVLAVSAIVMSIFGLLLALVIVDLYTSYKGASSAVDGEAHTLSKLIQDADAFPPSTEEAVRRAATGYIAEVRTHEFPDLRAGHHTVGSLTQLLRISIALRRYTPRTQTQISFYNSAVSQVNDLLTERQTRVSSAESSVPGPLTGLLIALAALSLVTALFLKTHNRGLDVLLVVSLAVIIGLGLSTALILEYPFSGSIAVSSHPLGEVATISRLTQNP